MDHRATRTKRDRRFQCELLEDRKLLSAVPALATAEIHTLKTKLVTQVLSGSTSGHFVSVGGHVTLNGSGEVNGMEWTGTGQFNSVANLRTRKGTVSGGTGTFTSGTDSISVKYSGTEKYVNGQISSSMKGTITGGTGKYAGATGSYTSSSTAPYTMFGTFQMSIKMTVKTRA
jgi:hypothetical protein